MEDWRNVKDKGTKASKYIFQSRATDEDFQTPSQLGFHIHKDLSKIVHLPMLFLSNTL